MLRFSIHKKINRKLVFKQTAPSGKKQGFPWLVFLTLLFFSWLIWATLYPPLPQPFEAPKLYSNQCQQDIRALLLTAIRKASKSIYLVMFGLTDRSILQALIEKLPKIPICIYYDAIGSAKVHQLLQQATLHPIQDSGLMHQKILILDEELLFLGSANMTAASLKMHDNLIVGMVSRSLCHFLKEHPPYTPGYHRTLVGGQEVEVWLLPDPRGHAFNELRKKIRSASRSIRIALFTFTHPHLIDEVIHAHERGVFVSIVIDQYSAYGASAQALEKLKKANIEIRLSQGPQLLHHKFIYIDEKTLLTGSANWTKSAFYKNSDCILALHQLNQEQRHFMKKLWKSIEAHSRT